MNLRFGHRRGEYLDVSNVLSLDAVPVLPQELAAFERFDLFYRALCALLFNYVPTSGHPGGSVSSGRFVAPLLFGATEYDLADPERPDADVVCYAAGHKAMGLYALWALRDELARVAAPGALPPEPSRRLHLEDLLGFRRNPTTATPLFRCFGARALDGHPTPQTPFVPVATGASGVGLAASVGLALGAAERYGIEEAPRVHVVEGEGGLTPGRVSEALAAAGTASLSNLFVHLDWNQASIDSEAVCRERARPGDYVQWDPAELFYLHDWNVIFVPDGRDGRQIALAQRAAFGMGNSQPTAIVYRTTKGFGYGVEGRASHGAGHALCSEGFYRALDELVSPRAAEEALPSCEPGEKRCAGKAGDEAREECFFAALELLRGRLIAEEEMAAFLTGRLLAVRDGLAIRARRPRAGAPRPETLVETATADGTPPALLLNAGDRTTLRGELGRCLHHLQEASAGAVLVAAADLAGSTSVQLAAEGSPTGFWNAHTNPEARLLAVGGICEDAITGVLSGIVASGAAIGVGSSYGAFMAPLGHIAARLHAIGQQAGGAPYRPLILVCAHAGLATGEDGPTHADPQPLQLLAENFPAGCAISLTPFEPQEVWPLLAAALTARPALIFPFVTRPTVEVLDRAALGLAPAETASNGLYLLRDCDDPDVVVVLQESSVAYGFVKGALPLLDEQGLRVLAYYVTSPELFDLLPADERCRRFPEEHAARAIGITGFTLPTLYRWVASTAGRAASLHPYRDGHYLGSGPGERVLAEAGLDGESQARAIMEYAGKA